MSVRVTGSTDNLSERTAALYDSVTGIAFGEVFETANDAEDFLQYHAATADETDLRAMTPAQFAHLRVEWEASRALS